MEEEVAVEEEYVVEKKSGGKKKIILLILLLLAGGGGAAWWFLVRPHMKPNAEALAAEKEKHMRFISLEPFVTNLATQDGSAHYLQIKIDLKTFDPDAEGQVNAMMPEIRNTILKILAGQMANQVGTVAGREALRMQILDAVNGLLETHGGIVPRPAKNEKSPPIAGVYFTAFVVQ